MLTPQTSTTRTRHTLAHIRHTYTHTEVGLVKSETNHFVDLQDRCKSLSFSYPATRPSILVKSETNHFTRLCFYQ